MHLVDKDRLRLRQALNWRNFLAFGVLGLSIGIAGFGIFDWQYWVILVPAAILMGRH